MLRRELPDRPRHPLIVWRQETLPRPILDPDLASMPALRRAAVILHNRMAAIEYALSPNGFLRAFIRLCALLGLLVGIPVLLIVPPVVLLIYALVDISVALVEVLRNVLTGLLYLLAILAIGGLLVALFNQKTK
jgi:hypothetical protein